MTDEDEEQQDNASEPDSDSTDTDTPDEEPVDVTEMDPSEVSVEDLEEQEWTLGGGPTEEIIEFKGMKFLIEDPDDDTVLNMMAQAGQGDADTSQRLFDLATSAIKAPELTMEQWRDMRMSERVGLTFRIADAIGLADMMDFPEGGPSPQQAR